MKLITELVEDVKTSVIEEGKEPQYFIEGIFLQADIKNRNGRIYPVEVLEREVERYNTMFVKEGRAYGELGHPSNPSINLDRVSHLIVELRQDGTNFYGKAKILDTPMGDIVKGILKSGGKLGVSSRGLGSLKEANGVMIVQEDFELKTAADIVADPSAPDAFVNGIMEGVEFFYEDGKLVRKEIHAEEAKRQIEENVRKRTLDDETKLRIFEQYIQNILKTI